MHPTIARLQQTMNDHDARAMAALFSPEYRSEQPAHPDRGFGGHAQVEKNWAAMFDGVPDMAVEVLASATEADLTWSEWDWRGHHRDGSDFAMRGVILFGLTGDGAILSARLYMEPVERGGAGIDDAVQHLSGQR